MKRMRKWIEMRERYICKYFKKFKKILILGNFKCLEMDFFGDR